MNTFKYFIGIIVLQLFFGFGITILSHSLIGINPDIAPYMSDYTDIAPDISNITTQIEGSMQSQLNIPVVDLGALVFYSGNIIVDLMLNFFFAVPSLFTLIANGFFGLFNIDAFLEANLKLFIYSIVSVLYFINLLAFIMNIRSRGSIV